MDREFLISQYADGTISDADRAALEAILAQDADARALLAGEQRLTRFLSAANAPMQVVHWDALAARISAAVDRAEEPAPSYRLVSRWSPVGMALAASLLIASSIGISVYLSTQHTGAVLPQQTAIANPVLIVTGPVAEAAPNGVAEVSIGPAPQLAGNSDVSRYSSDLVTHQSRLIIASGINPPTSTDAFSLPY